MPSLMHIVYPYTCSYELTLEYKLYNEIASSECEHINIYILYIHNLYVFK